MFFLKLIFSILLCLPLIYLIFLLVRQLVKNVNEKHQ
jgi:hypothetical protein